MSLNVLVVDDLDLNRRVVGALVARRGHRVTTAADGAEAVAAVLAGDFDAVLMDLQMPGIDGFEAAHRIGAALGHRSPRLVALSAQFPAPLVTQCRDAGFAACLPKPFAPAALDAALSTTAAAVASDD